MGKEIDHTKVLRARGKGLTAPLGSRHSRPLWPPMAVPMVMALYLHPLITRDESALGLRVGELKRGFDDDN